MRSLHRAALAALGAAILFGASTPFAKQLIGNGLDSATPLLLAGQLYFGSSLALYRMRLLTDKNRKSSRLPTEIFRKTQTHVS